MTNNLSPTQESIVELLPATAVEIAHEQGYKSTSTVYDHISDIRSRGYDIAQSDEGEYVVLEPDGGVATVTNHVEARRQTATSKAAKTRAANEYLTELEQEIKTHRNAVGPVIADGGMVRSDQGQDIVMHRTDDQAPGGASIPVDWNFVWKRRERPADRPPPMQID